jgi:hypothetical protein
VRRDIAEQLNLDHQIFVGASGGRSLSVHRRSSLFKQINGVLERHRGESGIICVSGALAWTR